MAVDVLSPVGKVEVVEEAEKIPCDGMLAGDGLADGATTVGA